MTKCIIRIFHIKTLDYISWTEPDLYKIKEIRGCVINKEAIYFPIFVIYCIVVDIYLYIELKVMIINEKYKNVINNNSKNIIILPRCAWKKNIKAFEMPHHIVFIRNPCDTKSLF